jgi:hypothetical protein
VQSTRGHFFPGLSKVRLVSRTNEVLETEGGVARYARETD